MNRVIYHKKYIDKNLEFENYNSYLINYFDRNIKPNDGFTFNRLGNFGEIQIEKFLNEEHIDFLFTACAESLETGDIQYFYDKHPQFKYIKDNLSDKT